MSSCCYVSAYFDIGRKNWPKFKRTFNDYLTFFTPFVDLFDAETAEGDEMIVFIDSKHYEELDNLIKSKPSSNITLINLTEELLNTLPMWKTLPKETEIMQDPEFRKLLGVRSHFPEHNYPEYTLINHCKIDFIGRVIDLNFSNAEVYSWVDFGYFSKIANIPDRLLDLTKFDLDKVNYTLIEPLEEIDKDIIYTLVNGLERIGGFFFLGKKDVLKQYQSLYHEVLNYFQNTLNIADDDQALVLQCYNRRPDLFSFNTENLGWHRVLSVNQKKPLKVISFCLWGKEKRYVRGLIENIKLAKKYYSEWVCWCYLHVESIDMSIVDEIKQYDNAKIILKYDKGVRAKRFMLFRFEPILHTPRIEYFMSRDTDTRISLREVLAVEEWIESGKTLHIIRDHPRHRFNPILGGLYGVKTLKLYRSNWSDMIENFFKVHGEEEDEQNFLKKYIYDIINVSDRVIHDEFKNFNEFNECKEFPIKFEQNGLFCGGYVFEDESVDVEITNELLNYLRQYLPHRLSEDNISLESKLNYISQKIDHIYIVHYTKLVERKENMIKELKNVYFDIFFGNRIIWVDQFDRENFTSDWIQNNCAINPKILNRRLSLPEISNMEAHRYILHQIKDNDDMAIVYEDDTVFKPNFIHHLFYILKNLPENFETMCLGGGVEINTVPARALDCSIKMDFKSEEIIFFTPSTPAPVTVSSMLHSKKAVIKALSSEFLRLIVAPSDHIFWCVCMDKKISMLWSQPFITYEASKTDLFETSMGRGY